MLTKFIELCIASQNNEVINSMLNLEAMFSNLMCSDSDNGNTHSHQQQNNPNLNLRPSVSYGSSKGISQPSSPPPTQTASTATSPMPLTVDDCTSDPNWQAFKISVRERNAITFNNDLMSDVLFIVGQKGLTGTQRRIPGHKYVLAAGSPVFYAMFFGALAEHQNQIEIPDVEPEAFLTLLRYLYCDDICIEACNALACLYAAKKYFVPHLARACVSFLETSLTAENACELLSQSRLYEEPDLMQRCWEVIDAQAELALASDGFVDIDYQTLESILSRETLNAKELSIFYSALLWANAECRRRELHICAENQRKVLADALFLVRFPAMNLEEFADGPAQSGLLTLQETTDIFLNYTAVDKPVLSFPTRARLGLQLQTCHRFQSSAYRSNQWRYRGRCDSIQFSADRRIFVAGIGLYGSSNGGAHYKVKIELKSMGEILAENDSHFYSDGSSNTFAVFFENAIQVEANLFYTVSAILDGDQASYFGEDGVGRVTVDGGVSFQFQCSADSTNGTGVHGGQIPEIIFYGTH